MGVSTGLDGDTGAHAAAGAAGGTMKAAVYEQYGSPEVIRLMDVPLPSPQAHEVLVKVRATTVTTGDWRVRSLQLPRGFGFMGRLVFGVTKPRQPILGSELAGEIVAVGKDVSRFQVGDRVFAFTDAAMGCHVEFKCLNENAAMATIPANLSYEEAAAIPFGGTTALVFLKRARIQAGDRVLITGAGGGVGTAAVQLAKHFGATVTGVCSADKAELVTAIGADRVIDYTREDVTANGETYDIIVDTVGTLPYARSKGALAPGGRLLQVLGTLADLLTAPWAAMTSDKKVIAGPVGGSADNLRFLAGLAAAGAFRPVIGRRFAFSQIADAHRYVDSGHKQGSAVVTVGDRQPG